MKYIILFLLLVSSITLHAQNIQPKLFAKLGTPLYDASEIFLRLQQLPSLTSLVDDYVLNIKKTMEMGLKADISNDKSIKISYLKALRSLQKKHDKIVAFSTKELNFSIKNNDYKMFLDLVNISMIFYIDDALLSEKIITHYLKHKSKGRSNLLEIIIKNQQEIETVYYEEDKLSIRQCYRNGHIWDVDTCLEVTYGRVKKDFGIEIVGSKRFTKQLTRALYLLKHKSYGNFLYVKKHLGKIVQTNIANGRRGIAVHENPPTWYTNNVSVLPSLKWCAGVLVHEAHHSYLYSSYKYRHKTDRVPRNVVGEEGGELACNKKQAKAMKDIGSSKSSIEWLLSQDGKHGDLNGDGKHYTKADKALRAKLDLKRAKELGITDDM